MCLAPCFAGCSKEEYDAEVRRVLELLESQGTSLSAAVEREREAASEALDFERAAALHKKIEKISSIFRGLPQIAGRVDNLYAVVIQRAVRENTIALFQIAGGLIAEPMFLDFDPQSSQPRSIEAFLREHFAKSDARGPSASSLQEEAADSDPFRDATTQHEEHLSILARWYYSNPREGEILFRGNDWPYRKILRACARVLAEVKADS